MCLNHLHGARDTFPVTENLIQIFSSQNVSQSCLRQQSNNQKTLKLFLDKRELKKVKYLVLKRYLVLECASSTLATLMVALLTL